MDPALIWITASRAEFGLRADNCPFRLASTSPDVTDPRNTYGNVLSSDPTRLNSNSAGNASCEATASHGAHRLRSSTLTESVTLASVGARGVCILPENEPCRPAPDREPVMVSMLNSPLDRRKVVPALICSPAKVSRSRSRSSFRTISTTSSATALTDRSNSGSRPNRVTAPLADTVSAGPSAVNCSSSTEYAPEDSSRIP